MKFESLGTWYVEMDIFFIRPSFHFMGSPSEAGRQALAASGEPRSEQAESLPTSVGKNRGRSGSAKRTATLIGCSVRKVEKMRKIRKDGPPEIQRAVRTNKMSINRAYTLIRQMEKGKPNSSENPGAARVKEVKILFSEENFAILKELGGDLGAHVNKAIEVYIRSLHATETGEASDEA